MVKKNIKKRGNWFYRNRETILWIIGIIIILALTLRGFGVI